ncbi:hypothetical protein F2P56_026594 [Juglans regia]|uniref:RING-type E3 ubiquitin transferase n=2 Tax=Juglans regia TaxID=51240 RepID=A0A2I4FF69_JUGRE|nr:E3 ubiquitin-protein ligase ATL6-like [Juglans regia]KAF5451488.1 hypothetical protein F2P56_026594 [Juglans regia]
MRVPEIILCRPIIPCVVLLFHRANALPGTASPASISYGPNANLDQYSMVVVILFLMCAFFFMAFFSIYIRECLESSATVNQTAGSATAVNTCRNQGLDRAMIETCFPMLVYSTVKDLNVGKGALQCAVCLSEFEDYEKLRLLPKCDHVFHPVCIDAWLASHLTCPVCRAMLTPDELAPEEAQSRLLTQEDATTSELGEVQKDHILIDIDDDESTAEIVSCDQGSRRISENFPRSHSTGHSLLVQPGEHTDRCTLRLPEEVIRKQIVESTGRKLRRSSSYDAVLGRLWSSRNGYRNGGDREK